MAKKVILISADKELFEVDLVVACQSQTIKQVIEVKCVSQGIPLHNVSSKVLEKVIEYCKKHVEAAAVARLDDQDDNDNQELTAWDAEFVKVDQEMLFDILLAANYLSIQELLDLMCTTVADMMRGKIPDQIRDIFNIKNDYTPEEEQAVIKENAWAFK